jgi:hypothetical protein
VLIEQWRKKGSIEARDIANQKLQQMFEIGFTP